MSSDEHWQVWLQRYGDDYSTDQQRQAAYRDFKANLAEINAVFSQSEEMYEAGRSKARERAASGDGVGPDDADRWVPQGLNRYARADWLEGFRSHFDPGPRWS